MKTLNITISESEFSKFGFKDSKLSFNELLKMLTSEILKQNLRKSVQLAEKYNLSQMTMEEISREVNAVRNAKNDH